MYDGKYIENIDLLMHQLKEFKKAVVRYNKASNATIELPPRTGLRGWKNTSLLAKSSSCLSIATYREKQIQETIFKHFTL